jgi:hypothetical protein
LLTLLLMMLTGGATNPGGEPIATATCEYDCQTVLMPGAIDPTKLAPSSNLPTPIADAVFNRQAEPQSSKSTKSVSKLISKSHPLLAIATSATATSASNRAIATNATNIGNAATKPLATTALISSTNQNLNQILITQLSTDQVATAKAADALPSDIMAVTFLNFSEAAWQHLDLFNPFDLESLDWQEQLLVLPEGMSFSADITPWLDQQVAIAFQLPPDLETITTENPDDFVALIDSSISVVIPSRSDEMLDDFLAELRENHSRQPETIDYEGYEILEWQTSEPVTTFPSIDIFGEAGNATAIASIDGSLVLASSAMPIKNLIDARTDAGSLADSQEFQRALEHPQWANSILASYGDYGEFAQFSTVFFPNIEDFEGELPFDADDITTGLQNIAKEYSKFEGYFWIAPDGFHAQSLSYYANPSPSRAYRNDANGILAKIPGQAFVSISSRNFKQQWQWLDEQSQLYPTYTFILDAMREATPEILGLDLEKDIIDWMDGEYAALLFPSNQGFGQAIELDLGLGLLVETSKRLAATTTLQKLTDFAIDVSDGEVQVTQREINGKTFTSWEVADPENPQRLQSVFAYGWLDNNTIAIATGKSQLFAFSPQPDPALADTELFKTAIANMPKPNLGYFFMNLDSLVDFTLAAIPPEFTNGAPKEVMQILDTLQSLSVAYSSTADHVQSDLYLGLEPIK